MYFYHDQDNFDISINKCQRDTLNNASQSWCLVMNASKCVAKIIKIKEFNSLLEIVLCSILVYLHILLVLLI